MKIHGKKTIKHLIYLFITTILLALFLPNQDLETVHAAKLNKKEQIMLKGEKFKLSLKGTSEKPQFTSLNPNIATVSSKGVIKGVGNGKTVITATISNKTYSCKVTVHDTMDIIVFAGQSNMTNVGKASQAPTVKAGTGYEAIPKKNKISPLKEPFGVGQIKTKAKRSEQGATLVSAFVNAYYKKTKTPVLAMNTAKGGTSIGEWSSSYYKNVVKDVKAMEKLLKKKGLKKGHVYVVLYQGENDALNSIVSYNYRSHMELFMKKVQDNCDAERCFVIRISNDMHNLSTYDTIAATQTKLCMEDPRFIMVSTINSGFNASYYQGDGIHLNQKGLNKVGTQAGKMAGTFVVTGLEPSMKDPRYKNTYESKCNPSNNY